MHSNCWRDKIKKNKSVYLQKKMKEKNYKWVSFFVLLLFFEPHNPTFFSSPNLSAFNHYFFSFFSLDEPPSPSPSAPPPSPYIFFYLCLIFHSFNFDFKKRVIFLRFESLILKIEKRKLLVLKIVLWNSLFIVVFILMMMNLNFFI